jgi:hypothetical protein
MTERPELDEKALEEISEIDRKWFEEHPGRSMYLRLPHTVEVVDDWRPDLTLVVQARPGFRLRLPIKGEVAARYQQFPHSATEAGCRKVLAELVENQPDHPLYKIVQAYRAEP